MMYPRTLASAMLVAFGAIGGRAAVVSARTAPTDATVISLSVVPRTGRADVVVRIDGAVTFKHFTLSKPDKIVVDLSGATLGLPQGDAYDGVARGGITRIRYSQFTKTIVRVVLTLDSPHSYTVAQENGEVRVSVEGMVDGFEPWSVKGGAAPKAEAGPALVSPAAAEPVASSVVPARSVPARSVEAKSVEAKSVEAPSRTPRVVQLSDKPQQTSQEPRITVSWENASINDVLALFAAFSQRTILPSKNVTGNVSATITNQPWDVALKKVMNANGYDVTVDESGIILVDTFDAIAARQATIPLDTKTVRLNYARAISVAPMVAVRLSHSCAAGPAAAAQQGAGGGQPAPGAVQSLACPQRGAVTADTITNSISITDVPAMLPLLEDYARSLDLRQPQVNIKAKIILVDRTTIEGLGLRYDLGSQQQFFNDIVPRLDSLGKPLTTPGQIQLGGNTISAIANATARVPSAALQLVYSTALGNFDFTTFVEALQTNTLLDVQAEPSGSVLNNHTVNLTAGTQVPIRVIDAGAGGNASSNFPRANVIMRQTGVVLIVTPQITNNRQIQMKVHVENSDVQFESSDVGAVFPTQQVDNEVLVADGETAVMGGLTQTTVNISRTGLPLLVDLPIIGRLFGVTNRTESKRDLLILITPHIIDDGQQLPEPRRP